MYKCRNCGFEFGEEGIQEISYREYPESSKQKEFVSACCGCTYDEFD